MSGLTVIATYDAEGRLWPHVRHQIDAHVRSYTGDGTVIVVAAGGLADADRAWAQERAQVVERDNTGYDFASYRAGLDTAGDLTRFSHVVLANDSFVGPVVSPSRIREEMSARGVDFWGLTQSREREEHLQSYYVGFSPRAVASEAFVRFWRDFEPVCDRNEVIERYELGLTRTLAGDGLSYGAYFSPTAREAHLARARRSWLAIHLIDRPADTTGWNHVRNVGNGPSNPCIALADRVFDAGRLPVVKIETLRDDPYGLGADTLLHLGEERCPEAFDGVRDYLDATRADRGRDYGGRAGVTSQRVVEARDLRYAVPDTTTHVAGLRRPTRYADAIDDPNTASAQVAALVGADAEVLDLGCGTGALGTRLAAQGCRVTGLEMDAEIAAYAGKVLADVVVARPDAATLRQRFGRGSFDVVVLAELVEHLADPAEVLEAAKDLLRPGGRIVVSTPNATHGSKGLALLQGRWTTTTLPLDRKPVQTYGRDGLLALLADAGLLATELRGTLADPLTAETGVPQATLPWGLVEWTRDQPDALVETFAVSARALRPGEHPAKEIDLVPAVDPSSVRLTDVHTERQERLTEHRRAFRQLPRVRNRVADLEARVAELEAELAQVRSNPVRWAAGKVKRRLAE